jgi:manganese transport protein
MLPRLVSALDPLAQLAVCEVAIGACDLAEVLGSAVALNLLFHIPLLWAVIITGLDVLAAAGPATLRHADDRGGVAAAGATIGVCYFIEIFVLPQTQPSFLEMGRRWSRPNFRQAGMIYVAIGIIGATVMPHNLYLHSALVQSRKLQKDEPPSAAPSGSTPSTRRWP